MPAPTDMLPDNEPEPPLSWQRVAYSPDALALVLARRTPLVVGVCLLLLLAGIIGSQLDLVLPNVLWAMPALGATSLGVAVWIWSGCLLAYPALGRVARRALRRALLLQWGLVFGGLAATLYFGGLAAQLW